MSGHGLYDPVVKDAMAGSYLRRWGRRLRSQRLPPRDSEGQPDAAVREEIVDQFHRLYYNDPGTWLDTRWLGVPAWKCPLDLWVYQEILHELRPALIVECGTAHGGSAYYLASICDLLGTGEIVTIDVESKPGRPAHPRITYILGSSVDADVIAQVRARLPATGNVLVILDSDHRAAHVQRELSLYAGMVTPGSYLIVEDTNINNHPVGPDFGPGPMEAVSVFLTDNLQFVVDGGREKYHLTFNPRGFLRRVRTVMTVAAHDSSTLEAIPRPRSLFQRNLNLVRELSITSSS